MAFNSYEELMEAVEERRSDTLTLEIDLGGSYSEEYEEAKTRLKQAEAISTMTGKFLADNMDFLKEEVNRLRPEGKPVWIRFKRLSLTEWSLLTKQGNLTPVEQYEKILPKTFVGVYGSDPDGEGVEPLSSDPSLVSSNGDKGILVGGALHSVIQAYMSWQNSGGEVTIRPTKSGQD